MRGLGRSVCTSLNRYFRCCVWLRSVPFLRTFCPAKIFTLASCKTLAIVENAFGSAQRLRAGKAAQGTAGVPPHACDAVVKS